MHCDVFVKIYTYSQMKTTRLNAIK